MKPIHVCLLTLLLSCSMLCAQENSLATGSTSAHAKTAVLEGLVTKDPSSEPVKKALIELIAENQSEAGNYTAFTGADGAFHIEGIVPGRYRLFVERTGYLEVNKHQAHIDGRVLTLSAGQELKDVLIRVQATAVVEGRVTDEDGDPLPNAQVSIQRQTFISGHRHWQQVAGVTTNDLGDYRIANLPSGNYYIVVTPPPDFKSVIETAGNAPADSRKNAGASDKSASISYTTTYYPGTKDRGQASPIQLHAGDNFPANFSLTPGPSVVVRGTITTIPPGATAIVLLQSKDFGMALNGAEVHKDGSFEVRDISPGGYNVIATVSGGATALVARQSLQVSAENVDGVRLVPQPGASIRGRLRFESRSAARVDASQIFLSLQPVDGDDVLSSLSFGEGFSSQAHVAADGSFEWKNVPAGHYYVQLSDDGGGDWFLKSGVAGGRDIDGSLSVNGSTFTIDLVASANGALVDGIVTNAKGEPATGAVVVAVPEAHFRQRTDRFHKTTSDQSGRFTLHGLAPGQYTIFAWESVDGDAYYNADFLKSCEGQGRTLAVTEGEKKSVQLEIIPAPEDYN